MNMKKIIKANQLYLISFFIPFLIMMAIFIFREIYPFGDESFLHIDMYHQYFPFLVEFFHKLKNGGSLLYSWNTGIGSNFLALFVYYLATPVYWLVTLFPESHLMEFITYLVVLKIGLCGASFSYYLSKHFKTDTIVISFFATFYALSGYMAAYNWNVMWLDTILIAPLILLGLERLVMEGKCKLYCITLAFSILSNYYISVLICEFLVLYFFVLLICRDKSQVQSEALHFPVLYKIKNFYIKAFIRFGVYSLLAGGMAAVLLIPELCALRFTEFSNVTFPKKITSYFSVIDMLARHCANVTVETGLDHWPNLYCGVAVFFLLPLYVIQKKIPLREKVPKLCLLFFLLISYSTNVLNFIWHGFNYPDSLPARQSFLYIILLLTLCFEAFLYIKDVSRTEMLRLFGGIVFFLLLCEKLITDDAFTAASFLLSGILLIAYGILIHMYRNRDKMTKSIVFITLAIVIFEATENTVYTSVPTVSRSKYLAHFEDYRNLVERTKSSDPDFYRFEKFSRVTQNDAMLIGFPSASLFSSTSNALVKDFYEKYGMKSSRVYYCYDGATPLIDALLTVRYKFSTKELASNSLYQLVDEENGIYLYENQYALPVGYMIDNNMVSDSDNQRIRQEHTPHSNIQNQTSEDRDEPMLNDITDNNWGELFSSAENATEIMEDDSDEDGWNPFINQNNLVSKLNIDTPLFDAMPIDSNDDSASITVTESGYQYAYTTNTKIDNIIMSCGEDSKKFTAIKRKYILDLGYYEAGDTIYLTSNNGEALNLCAYRLNENVLNQVISALQAQTLNVTSYQDTSLSGTINVTTPGQLILSIPYEPGWTILVDGKEADINLFEDTMMSVGLTEGEHTIELHYVPQGFYPGLFISLFFLVCFLGLLFISSRYSRVQSTTGTSGKQRG